MYRKQFFITLIATAILCLGSLSAFAQTGAVRGFVKLKQADGTTVPVVDAVIDVYRIDVAGKLENNKTNKRGEFHIIGLFIAGKYVLSISAPGAQPFLKGGIKAGQDVDIPIVLEPGDGRRYTMEQAREMASSETNSSSAGGGGGGGGETAAERAEREDKIRKNSEITASNEKVKQANEIYNRVVKEGNVAYNAKNYQEAITKYSEAITADPDHPGAPVVLTNRSVVLRILGVEHFNVASKAKDEAGKTAAKKEWEQAAKDATIAVEKLKALSPPSEMAAAANFKDQVYRALMARAAIMKFYIPMVDPSKLDAAEVAYKEYFAAEPDPVNRVKLQLDYAQVLYQVGDVDKAIAEYKRVLEVDPENIEALVWVGIALFSMDDASKYQEAANYLQLFVDKAPDTHELKASAKETLDELKRKDVKPQKPTGRRRG
jgi:tetratricopeptide (TPR) repeat protein